MLGALPETVGWDSIYTFENDTDPDDANQIYGFRDRADYSYDENTIANSRAAKADRVWDILSRNQKRVILIGISLGELLKFVDENTTIPVVSDQKKTTMTVAQNSTE